MKHIELLTVESYLEDKSKLMENADYAFEEFHIDHVERISEIIEEIKEDYFVREEEEQEEHLFICTRKIGGYYEVEVSNSLLLSQTAFIELLKEKHKQLIENGQESEVSDYIKWLLNKVFIYSCREWNGIESRMYEIIKYTLTEERRCDVFDCGKYQSEMDEEEDIFPFEMWNESLPLYCQSMQQVLFGVHRKIFKCSKSTDITRFSFHKTRIIVEKVMKALRNTKRRRGAGNWEDNSCSYIEGKEDYILLDRILGISETNIIYWKTKEIKERIVQDCVIKIIKPLMRCQYSAGRNYVAQVLFNYLNIMEFDEKIIRIVEEILTKEVKVWNEYYEEIEAAILIPIFSYLINCPVSDYIEVCESIEEENSWSEYIYMDDIENSEEMKKAEDSKGNADIEKVENTTSDVNTDKIRIPKEYMNNRTWYAYLHKLIFEAIWRE